jgi:transposase
MEKLYVGVDLHKRSCWVTVLDADGHVLESRRIGTTKPELLEFFGQVRKPAAVAVEATFNWYYFLNVIEPLGLELHLVHPWKTRAIASARIKHDRLDSRVLAELLRTGFLAEAWIAPRRVREERQLLRYRVHTVQWATRAKNSIHGVLNRNGIRSPLSSPFGPKGRQFLEEVELAGTDRWEVDGQLQRLDLLGEQLAALDREIRKKAKASPVARALEEIPGIGPFIASLVIAEVGDVRRFPSAKHLVSYTGLAPSLYASGEHRWGGPITKQGSSVLRWALVQAAHRAALNPRFYGFYQRQRERHGTSRAAVALARKLAVIVFYRWRHALHVAERLPRVEKVRERTSGGAWSEHRPSTCD